MGICGAVISALDLLVFAAFLAYLCVVWAAISQGWWRLAFLLAGGSATTITGAYAAGVAGPPLYSAAMLTIGGVLVASWALLRTSRLHPAERGGCDRRSPGWPGRHARDALQRRVGIGPKKPLGDDRVLLRQKTITHRARDRR